MTNEILEKDFPCPTPARLKVEALRGPVQIRSGNDGNIHVRAVRLPGAGDAEATQVEMRQAEDGSVEIATHFRKTGWDWLRGRHACQVEIQITAPRACSIHVDCVNSDLLMEHFSGEFDLHSVNGGMNLHDLDGKMWLDTQGGTLNGEDLQGHLLLSTVTGDVRLDRSRLTSIKAETVSGKLDFQTPLGEGPYYCGSGSGAVRLRVPSETKCSLELLTARGKIACKLPITAQTRINGAWLAAVQGGGVDVRVTSISGWLAVEPG